MEPVEEKEINLAM